MDVDPSPFSAETLLESISESAPAVCLPYCLVPGMDIASQSYQKAVVTLGKQVNPLFASPQVPLISVLDRGTSLVPFTNSLLTP